MDDKRGQSKAAQRFREKHPGYDLQGATDQFALIAEARPDAIPLFRNGTFYEVYLDYARLFSRILTLNEGQRKLATYTGGRGDGDDKIREQPMTGLPNDAAPPHIRRLLAMGYRVAIAEQLDQAHKTTKRRALSRVITPGTITDVEFLDDDRRLLCSVVLTPKAAAIATLDAPTAELTYSSFSGDDAHAQLYDELARLSPAEVLYAANTSREMVEQIIAACGLTLIEQERIDEHKKIMRELNLEYPLLVGRAAPLALTAYDERSCRELIEDQFGTQAWMSAELTEKLDATLAIGALLSYLRSNNSSVLTRLVQVNKARLGAYLRLDTVARRSLELTTTVLGAQHGALLQTIRMTVTPMGARLFREWLETPLRDVGAIVKRQDAVQALIDHALGRAMVRDGLKHVGDMARVVGRVVGTLDKMRTPDLVALRTALTQITPIAEGLTEAGRPPHLPDCGGALELLKRALADYPRQIVTMGDGPLIKPGWNMDLDTLIDAEAEARSMIARLVERFKQQYGLKSLTQTTDKDRVVFKLDATDVKKAPSDWTRLSTKTPAYFMCAELKPYADVLEVASEKRLAAELAAWEILHGELKIHAPFLTRMATALAQIDVLASLAELAAWQGWCRPEFVEGRMLSIVGGCHPVISRYVENYVPSTIDLDETQRLLLLTGANMSGKSTVMRMVAHLVILAQMGSFVPAIAMKLSAFDRIYTRIGAADDLVTGRSTYKVETEELANVCKTATTQSLVILDEVGRGTSTNDGRVLAKHIARKLYEKNGCLGIFATHYHELVGDLKDIPGIVPCQMAVHVTDDGDVIYLHELRSGSAGRSYGLAVARKSGIPLDIIEAAERDLALLEGETLDTHDHPEYTVAGVP